jgi:hypothetical protein
MHLGPRSCHEIKKEHKSEEAPCWGCCSLGKDVAIDPNVDLRNMHSSSLVPSDKITTREYWDANIAPFAFTLGPHQFVHVMDLDQPTRCVSGDHLAQLSITIEGRKIHTFQRPSPACLPIHLLRRPQYLRPRSGHEFLRQDPLERPLLRRARLVTWAHFHVDRIDLHPQKHSDKQQQSKQ